MRKELLRIDTDKCSSVDRRVNFRDCPLFEWHESIPKSRLAQVPNYVTVASSAGASAIDEPLPRGLPDFFRRKRFAGSEYT